MNREIKIQMSNRLLRKCSFSLEIRKIKLNNNLMSFHLQKLSNTGTITIFSGKDLGKCIKSLGSLCREMVNEVQRFATRMSPAVLLVTTK